MNQKSKFVKRAVLTCCLALLIVSHAFSQNARDTTSTKQYLMVVYSTNYFGLAAGSSIKIHYPDRNEPEILKVGKKEDYTSRLLKELNSFASQGWEVMSVHNKSHHTSGDSGTSSDETVYLLQKR